ncbi:LysR family transcriptional regulator [Citricoccus nitrophenolicus]|uniref:LysR family transcriptional regulator n=1 Tax=Citricoccus nitrophenolicus TaxID=863575 RepID=A0ABV0IHU6_9MICC
MDVETMRTFLSVARNRSISRAAQELFATQPTISLRIKRMEAELGFAVFSRSWRGAELTPQGRHVLPTIADHLIRLQTATAMAQQDGGHSGTSSILDAHAALESVAVDEWIVGEGIAALVQALDVIEGVHLTVTDSARLQSMVAHGVCTRGITYATPAPQAWSAKETVLWEEPLAVVHPRGESLAEPYSTASLREFFASRKFILMDDPVFTDHAGITGPMLEAITPAGTTVVDHTSIMAALCTLPGHATIVPAGLCARKPAFAQDGVEWSELDPSWGLLPVVMIGAAAEPTAAEREIDGAVLAWAREEGGI